MGFSDFLNDLKSKANELKDGVLKYKNENFLRGMMAGAALVALADGTISSEEKKKMISFIEKDDKLSVFKTSETITAFTDFVSQLEFDKDIGEAKAYQAIGKLRDKPEAGRLLVRMVISIASSDNNFDADEKKVVIKIAKELGLDPADFELV